MWSAICSSDRSLLIQQRTEFQNPGESAHLLSWYIFAKEGQLYTCKIMNLVFIDLLSDSSHNFWCYIKRGGRWHKNWFRLSQRIIYRFIARFSKSVGYALTPAKCFLISERMKAFVEAVLIWYHIYKQRVSSPSLFMVLVQVEFPWNTVLVRDIARFFGRQQK